jgi:hypothetical protein
MYEKEPDNNFKLEQLLLSYIGVCIAVRSTDTSQNMVNRKVDSYLTHQTHILEKLSLSLNINAYQDFHILYNSLYAIHTSLYMITHSLILMFNMLPFNAIYLDNFVLNCENWTLLEDNTKSNKCV